MKVRKSVLWSVLSFLAGLGGVVLALAAAAYAIWRTMGGHSLKKIVYFDLFGLEFGVSWKRFIFACGVAVVLIILSVIFKSIGKAVYRKRLKKAIAQARLANSCQGGILGMTPEMQGQVAETAKKLVPVVATVAVACVVFGTIRRANARRRLEELQMSRYYRY